MSVNFARQATGLVRQAGAKDVFVYNVNFINIGIGVAFMFLFMPNGTYPGVNIYASTLLCTICCLPTSLVYAMFSAAMPRSGGDYIYVSRAISPLFGFAASWNYTIWCFFYIGVPAAFLGKYGTSAFCRALGVYFSSTQLVTIGDWFSTPLGTAVTGTVLIVLFAIVFINGVTAYMKVQNLCFYIATLGSVATCILLCFHTPGDSIAAFNDYSQVFTGTPDTYKAITDTLGSNVVKPAAFNLHNTLASMTWPFFLLGFSIASAYIGGEIKGSNRSQMIGMPGSLLYSAAWVLVLSWAILHAFGEDFLANLGAVSADAVHLSFTPTFSELAMMLTHNIWLILLIGISFALWTYTWLPIYILTATRNILAWSLDGLLPSKMADVDERTHSPLVAIVFSSVLGIIFLWIYAYDADFATMSGFFGQVVGTFLLTSAAAIVFPYVQPDIFNASPVAWRVSGVPVLSILGVLSTIGMAAIAWAFLNDPQSGISFEHPFMLLINAGVFVAGFLFFLAVRVIRARQGIDINLAFLEIPPE